MDTDNFKAIMDSLQRRDHGAMVELLERYGAFVRAAVRRSMHERIRRYFDELDFVNEVWIELFGLPPDRLQFATPEALAGFLGRVARNKVADAFRRRFQSKKYDIEREGALDFSDTELSMATDQLDPELIAIAAERWDALLAQLPPTYHPILQMLRDGFTYDEIAAGTGMSVQTVNRVVKRLRRNLDGGFNFSDAAETVTQTVLEYEPEEATAYLRRLRTLFPDRNDAYVALDHWFQDHRDLDFMELTTILSAIPNIHHIDIILALQSMVDSGILDVFYCRRFSDSHFGEYAEPDKVPQHQDVPNHRVIHEHSNDIVSGYRWRLPYALP